MKYELRQLSIEDNGDIYDMLKEIPQNDNGYINNVNGMTYEEFKEWLITADANSKSKEITDGWKVPSTVYWLYVNGKPVGSANLRHFLSDRLKEEGGHIGYVIRPTERCKGYCTAMLKLVLNEARKIGIEKALITVNNGNAPSIRVACHCGGVIEKTTDKKHYITIETGDIK